MVEPDRVEEVDEVLGGEVAGRAGRVGQPPVPPVEASKQRTPADRPGRDVGERRAARVVEVERDPLERDPGVRGPGDDRADLRRDADADRVAEADLVEPEGQEADGDVDRPLRGDGAGVRAAEGGRDVAAPPPAELAGAREDRRERHERLVDRHPDVAGRERVGRGGEDGDRVGAGRLGSGEAADVRDEDRVADAGPSGEGGHQLVGVGELGDRGRRDERRRLDLAEARVGEQLQVAELRLERDGRGFVLEAVARPDFVDPDAIGR